MPDGVPASGWGDQCVNLFNVNDGAVLRKMMHHDFYHGPVRGMALALMPDGLRFVSGNHDGRACIVYHGLAPH